jgi:hypothetical protein
VGEENEMKKLIVVFTALVVLAPSFALAAPQKIQILTPEQRQKRQSARLSAKSVDLSKIEDSETRLALQVLFDSMNLKTKAQS